MHVWYDYLYLLVPLFGEVPSLRVITGVVSITFTLLSLVISLITLFLVVTDKSSFYFILSPLRVFAFSKGLPEVLYVLIKEFRFGANSPSSVCKGADNTVFGHSIMMAVPLKVLVSMHRFAINSKR